MALVGSCLHDIPHAFVDNHFANDILTQRPLDVGSRGQGAAPEQQFRVRIHGGKHEYLQAAVDEGGSQQVVDGEGPGGDGARGVACGVGEALSQLLIVEYDPVAIRSDLDLVCAFDVGRRGVVAADPGGQPGPRVGAHRQRGPVQGAQRLVFPIKVPASVRGQEGVGDAKLEDRELGTRLEVEGFPDVEFEAAVVPRDSLPRVHIDCYRHPFLTPETPPRRLLGGLADLPHPLRVGQPPWVHDTLRARAAVHIPALSVADRAAAQELAHHLAQQVPHFRSQSVPPSACRTFRPGASDSG